jgi:hypothetical protein
MEVTTTATPMAPRTTIPVTGTASTTLVEVSDAYIAYSAVDGRALCGDQELQWERSRKHCL